MVSFLVSVVVSGLVPGIHVFCLRADQDVDGRDKPGHDGNIYSRARSAKAPLR
jgi:hypothetical protein